MQLFLDLGSNRWKTMCVGVQSPIEALSVPSLRKKSLYTHFHQIASVYYCKCESLVPRSSPTSKQIPSYSLLYHSNTAYTLNKISFQISLFEDDFHLKLHFPISPLGPSRFYTRRESLVSTGQLFLICHISLTKIEQGARCTQCICM